MADIFNMVDTWTASGTTYTGIKLNVTDTASAAGSLLMDLRLNNTSVLNLTKAGVLNTTYGVFGGFVYATGGFHIPGNASGYSWGTSQDLFLMRDAANTLAQRNGTNAQALRVYETYTDASNYSRGVFDYTTNAGNLTIGTKAAGTGTARPIIIDGTSAGGRVINFRNNGTGIWYFATAGHFVAETDNTYDIGASGATRPRNVYVGTNVYAGFEIVATSRLRAPNLFLDDGIAAPATVAGFAQIFVDTADGDLKVKFGDGTVKTIVVDT